MDEKKNEWLRPCARKTGDTAGERAMVNMNEFFMNTLIKKITMGLLLLGSAGSVLAADLKANYDKHCAKCHGPDGKGATKMGKQAGAKDYTDAQVQAELDDAKGFKSVKEGMKEGAKEKMKPFADKLSDDEIKALIAHFRTFKK